MMKKRFLFILSRAPKGNSTTVREFLDLAFAYAAFDQHVDIVFYAEGVRQLLLADEDNPNRNYLQSAQVYGVRNLYYLDQPSDADDMKANRLLENSQRIEFDAFEALRVNSDHIFHS